MGKIILLSILLIITLPINAAAILNSWQISGSNNARLEYYEYSGAKSGSPYQDTGMMSYDELSLYLNNRDSPFSQWRIQANGVVNQSNYRSSDDGVIPERFNLLRENGDTLLPYRFEVGNIYTFFSQRSLQRSLIGSQAEIQPDFNWQDKRMSVLLVSGAWGTSWNHFNVDQNYTNGASALLDLSGKTQLAFSLFQNTSQVNESLPANKQMVYSLAGARTLEILSQKLNFDGEMIFLNGDSANSSQASSKQGSDEYAYYFEMASRHQIMPLDYRILYEQSSDDMAVYGASLVADRSAIEFHLGWRFSSGLNVRGRTQRFVDRASTDNSLVTETVGLTLNGSLLPRILGPWSGSMSALTQARKSDDRSSHSRFDYLNLNLSRLLLAGWRGNFGLSWNNNEDLTSRTDSTTEQLSLMFSHHLKIKTFGGSILVGGAARNVDSISSSSKDFTPSISFSLAQKNHSLGFNLGGNVQNRETVNSDVDTINLGANYNYSFGQNLFGLQYNKYRRIPDSPNEKTDAYLVAAFWRYEFDKPAVRSKSKSSFSEPLTPELAPDLIPELTPQSYSTEEINQITDIKPGSSLSALIPQLAPEQAGNYQQDSVVNVFERNMIPEVDQRQRLAITATNDMIEKVTLLIEFDNIGDLRDHESTFKRLKNILVKKYGNPDNSVERGVFGPEMTSDLNFGNFQRRFEWITERGVIRFGIPNRLDGLIRMELQYFLSEEAFFNEAWGVEGVQ
jgi:hypothetical protein